MAAPATTTIKCLNGSWVMDRSLSDPTDPILSLQGMGWMMRKVLGMATVTLSVKEYTDESNPQAYHIDIDQTVTGGIQGTREERVLDWQEREHVDTIFGKLRGKSRFLRGSKTDDGKVRPAVDFQTQVGDAESDARVQRFLRGEVLLDGSAAEGFVVDDEGAEFGEGEGLWMQSFVVNEESGWTAEQIWGFEVINGERRYTRRVAVVKGKKVEMARLVYEYKGSNA
ncbi:hypothetical protein POX_a01335 [Penicillium oxalicum]|uniref:Uncharacterized protein n=1 Tax=Penicillium oxalicum (strain 114-2 / CGMCC 5302) TaxID=933388 RepID=S7ZTA0_PENO1|nr:hypothetical protein POX_a01335 [Penicillium oxalicum]EPS33669.1 hypothetical protein PDE_08631 [Penicillium oxalicum 114-2]KAI2794734.1 hypothetical protein POX_a01335 [Penicillium oxalicum]